MVSMGFYKLQFWTNFFFFIKKIDKRIFAWFCYHFNQTVFVKYDFKLFFKMDKNEGKVIPHSN